ncbi:hypothetical protein BHE74_00007608 [Ensete ventricosum]|nr:hypothetical protein BHE74_00007608 [Ensete ventricosum]
MGPTQVSPVAGPVSSANSHELGLHKSKRPKEKMFGAPRDLHDNLLLPLNGHCEVTTAGGPIYKDVRKGVR